MTVEIGKVYRHKKGNRYLVLHVVEESTNARSGSKGVVYVSLGDGRINHRDLSEFEELVVWPDGEKRPRFVLDKETDI
jgi:hypothetical protein